MNLFPLSRENEANDKHIISRAIMTDRKKNRGKKFDEDEPPTKEEYAVAKFLRFNIPTREGKLHNMEVHCFFATAAVDALLESKWSASKNAKDALFYNRHTCVNYCQRLMQKGLFHRAERVQRKKDKEKGDKSKKKKGKEASEKEDTGTGDELRERKGKKDRKGKKEKEDSAAGDKTPTSEKEEGEKTEEGKKKKEKRLKLVMTDDQRFLDGEENIYVWVYDPANAKTLIIGSLIVLGAIALCLFPLWPEVVRLGVYYLSLAAAGFVGFILALVVIRLILFCFVWLLTLGRHHFWLLPNLTEDVGFFDSFRPLYQHESVAKDSAPPKDKGKSSSSSKSSKKSDTESKTTVRKKEKTSDKEESGSEQEEFEVIERGEVEEGRAEEEEEEGASSTDMANKDDKGPEEEEDYEEDEEEENGGADDEGEEEEDSLSKKDK